MDIVEVTKELVQFYERGIGHTVAMLDGTMNTRCFIVAESYDQAHLLASQCPDAIPMGLDGLRRIPGLPVLVDNSAMILLSGGLLEYIDRLEK